MASRSFYCNNTSDPQIFTVPDHVYLLHFLVKGAVGGTFAGAQSRGGQVSASLGVVPGNEIKVIVGCKGGDAQVPFGGIGGIGGQGYGKGGNGGNGRYTITGSTGGAGGGGGTAVIYEENGFQQSLVAGGGGGHARASGDSYGGYPSGGNGSYDYPGGGEGGQASRPGRGGMGVIDGKPGFGPNGGNGASVPDSGIDEFGGGGGGGGHYGGGGGAIVDNIWGIAGGGGSSYYDKDVFFNFAYQNGVNEESGSVVITYDFVNEDDVHVSGLLSAYTVQLGDSVFNKATVSGLSPDQLQDTLVTFQVFTPDNTSCQGEPFYQDVQPMMGSSQVQSLPFPTQHGGTYRWKIVLSYGGLIKETTCGDTLQNLQVSVPVTVTTMSVSPNKDKVPLNQNVTSTIAFENLSPSLQPEVTFQVFPAGCQGAAVFTYGPVAVIRNQVTSGPFVATLPGTYQWIVTVKYTTYQTMSTSCQDTSLRFTVVDKPSEEGEGHEMWLRACFHICI